MYDISILILGILYLSICRKLALPGIVFNWKVASTKEEPHVPIFMKGEARKTACLFIWLQYTLIVSCNPILYCRTLRHNIRTLYANEILSIQNYDLTHMILVSSKSSLIFVTQGCVKIVAGT